MPLQNATAQNLAPNPDFSADATLFTISPGYTSGDFGGNPDGGKNINPADIPSWYSFITWHGVNGNSAPINFFGPMDQTGVAYYAFKHGGGSVARLFCDPFILRPNTSYRLSFKCASGYRQTTGDLTNNVFINFWDRTGHGSQDLGWLTFTAPRESFASYSYDFTTGADVSGSPRILWDTDSSSPKGNTAALAQVSLIVVGAVANALTYDAPAGNSTAISPLAGSGGLTKMGRGKLTLAAANTYKGATVVSNGSLVVNGAIGAGDVAVKNGATLGGGGIIGGAVTVEAGGVLRPGLGGTDTSPLTVKNRLRLSGTTVIAINRANPSTASTLKGITTLTRGGSLVVTNVGPALRVDDIFTLFVAGSEQGTFTATNLPALAAGLKWTPTDNCRVLAVKAIP